MLSRGRMVLQGKQQGQAGRISSAAASESLPSRWLPELTGGPSLFRGGLLLKGDLVGFRAQRSEKQTEIDQGTKGHGQAACIGNACIGTAWTRPVSNSSPQY